MQLLLCCLCMSSCSDIEGDRPVLPPDQDGTEKPDTSQDYTELISKTAAVPVIYGQEAEHRGEVVRIDYNTRDYAEGTGRTRTNTAYVYLIGTEKISINVTMCCIWSMDTTLRQLQHSKPKTDWCGNCSTI